MEKEKVYEYVELDDRIPIQKLSLMDQLRIVLKRFTYDAGQELKRDDAVTKEEMRLRADLTDFLYKATNPIRIGEKRKVLMEISNKFDPVFNSVISSKKFTNYYNIKVMRPQIDYDVPFLFRLELEVK